jgi:hypothetical protein
MKMSLMSLVHTVADALSKAPVDSAEREMQVGAWKGAYLPRRIEDLGPPPPEIELEAISKYNILYTYFNRNGTFTLILKSRNFHIN